MARSVLDIFSSAREIISLHGRDGIVWNDLLRELALPVPALEQFLFDYLRKTKYSFIPSSSSSQSSSRSDKKQKKESIEIEIQVYSEVTKSTKIIAPIHDIYQFLGIKGDLEIPPDPGLLVLEKIGKSREKGLLITEISKFIDKKSNIYPTVDKLVAIGLVHKRMMMPIKSISGSRGKGRVGILHLARFASLYNPKDDHMQVEVDESACQELQQAILNQFKERNVTLLPLFTLAPYFQMISKDLRRKIGSCISQLKAKCKLKMIPLLLQNKGPFIFVQLNDGERVDQENFDGLDVFGDEDEDENDDDNSSLLPTNTIHNMTVYEQVNYRLNMFPNGLSSRKIRQMVGLTKKRNYSIFTTLIKALKYRHSTVQSGRQRLYLLFGQHPFHYPGNKSNSSVELMEIEENLRSPEAQIDTRRTSSHSVVESEGKETIAKQFDLYTIRKQILIDLLEKSGGIIDNYTFMKEAEKVYKELQVTAQVDRKTVKRLLSNFIEEKKDFKIVIDVTHPEIKIHWMKPTVVLRKDFENSDEFVLKYVYKLYSWYVSGRNGNFLEQLDILPDHYVEPLPLPEVHMNNRGSKKDEGEINQQLQLELENWYQELNKKVAEEFTLEKLSSYWQTSEEDPNVDQINMSLERINSLVSLCPHLTSSKRESLEEQNSNFLEKLKSLYHQLIKSNQTTDDKTTVQISYTQSLLLLNVKTFIQLYGLPEDYLQDIDKRIQRINLRKKYTPTTYDRIFIKSVQNGSSIGSLIFSKCSVASVLGRLMLTNATNFHKLSICCLLSLGIIRTSFPFDQTPTFTVEEFDHQILPTLPLEISIKPPGSTKILKKPVHLSQYWSEKVWIRIMEINQNCSSLLTTLQRFYPDNMPLGRYQMPEFPSLIVPEVPEIVRESPKKRAPKESSSRKRKNTPDAEIDYSIPNDVPEDMEIVEFEEVNQHKRTRKNVELIEASVDQQSTALISAIITLFSRPGVNLPQFLLESRGDETSVGWPWYHPNYYLLGPMTYESDISEQILHLPLSLSGGRRLTRKLPAIFSQYSTLRKILARIFKSNPLDCFDLNKSNEMSSSVDESKQEQVQTGGENSYSVCDMINDVLDETRRKEILGVVSTRIDFAVMNRALQIYFGHSTMESVVMTEETEPPIEDRNLETQFLEDIDTLKEFSTPTIFRIHRELCGKRYITRKIPGKKKGKPGIRGYEFREKVFQSLSAGLSGIYENLIAESYQQNIYPLLNDRFLLSEGPHLESSKGDLVSLLHEIASGHGEIGSGQILVSNTRGDPDQSEQETEPPQSIQVPIGYELLPSTSSENWPRKQSMDRLTGLFITQLERLQYTLESRTENIQTPFPSSSLNLQESASPLSSSEKENENEKDIVHYLENEINGKSFQDILCHLFQSSSGQSPSGEECDSLKKQLLSLCQEREIYLVPHYDANYSESFYYVHNRFGCQHYNPAILQQPVDQLRNLSIPLEQQELICPWFNLDGSRNVKLFSVFVGKVIGILTQKPNSTLQGIHGELPILTSSHIAILMKKLVFDGIVIENVFQFHVKLSNPFADINLTQNCRKNDRISYSLNPMLWENRKHSEVRSEIV